jgi:cation transport regulator ChaB
VDIDELLIEEDTPHYTELRPMLWGTFNLSQTSIPYFQAVISLEEATKELKLVENLPSDLRSKWKLEELFQREIDWERVRHDIVDGYLRRPEKLKFFNSLTVALLPVDERKMLANDYGDTPKIPDLKESLQKAPWQVKNIGGVQVITNSKSANGYIRWDPKRIFPATIDGQHRLASLQTLFNEGNLPSAALETKLSVIFLVLDPRAGFDITKMNLAKDENQVLTVVREVFIDLNKHAEEVNRSRRILLDDQEIECRCLRQLIAQRIGETPEDRLPLGIVHWQHNVTAKFNVNEQTGPFVTTVELLYSIIVDLLDLKRPKDPLDEKQVRKFVESIENALHVSQIIADRPAKYQDVKPLISYVEKMHLVEGFEVPFVNLTSPYLRACDEGFSTLWRPLLVGVLTQFKPYQGFIQEVKTRGGIDGELGAYLVLPRKAQDQQLKTWGEAKIDKIDKPLGELAQMKTKDWPFFAVFQKGLMRATAIAMKHFAVIGGGSATSTPKDFLDRWIPFLNLLWERGLFTVKGDMPKKEKDRIWAGISLTPASETVRWSEADVQRIAAMIVLWWYFYSSELAKVGSFLKGIRGARANERFPVAKELEDDLRKGLKSWVNRTDEELTDEEVKKRVDRRLKDLIKLAVNNAAPPDDGTDGDDDDNGNEDGADEQAEAAAQSEPDA